MRLSWRRSTSVVADVNIVQPHAQPCEQQTLTAERDAHRSKCLSWARASKADCYSCAHGSSTSKARCSRRAPLPWTAQELAPYVLAIRYPIRGRGLASCGLNEGLGDGRSRGLGTAAPQSLMHSVARGGAGGSAPLHGGSIYVYAIEGLPRLVPVPVPVPAGRRHHDTRHTSKRLRHTSRAWMQMHWLMLQLMGLMSW